MGIQNLTVTTDLYIDGDERPAQHGRSYELYNPARPSELVGHAAAASHEDVDQAVQAGHRFFPFRILLAAPPTLRHCQTNLTGKRLLLNSGC